MNIRSLYKENSQMPVIYIGFILSIVPVLLISWWTQNEFSYALSSIMNHAVHLNYFLAVLITIFFNAFTFCADIIITVLRSVGAM